MTSTTRKTTSKALAAPKPAAGVKQPEDHKPKAEDKPKPVVKTVEGGREVTLHGVTVTVLDSALGDFETIADLDLIEEVARTASESGGAENIDEDLARAAMSRVAPLMRRLFGIVGSQAVMRALRRESETGAVTLESAVAFIYETLGALNPNS
jgi:hypothetical protein